MKWGRVPVIYNPFLIVFKMKTIKKSLFVLALSSVLFTSCASILDAGCPQITLYGSSSDQNYTVLTRQSVYKDVSLPITVKVDRHAIQDQPIRIVAPNGSDHTIYLDKAFNSYSLLNILLGGLIGIGVDCATNCISKPAQRSFYIDDNWFQFKSNGEPAKTERKVEKKKDGKNVYTNIDDMFK